MLTNSSAWAWTLHLIDLLTASPRAAGPAHHTHAPPAFLESRGFWGHAIWHPFRPMIATASLHGLLGTWKVTAATLAGPPTMTTAAKKKPARRPPLGPGLAAGLPQHWCRPPLGWPRLRTSLLRVSAGPGCHTRKAATAAPARSARGAGCPFPGPGGAREPPSTRP